MIKVAIVDDHQIVRAGLRFFLSGESDIEIAAEGCTAEDALAIAAETAPDVMLMDLRMPGTDGIEALERMRTTHPEQKVLIVSTSDAESDIVMAVRGGAKGYVVKDCSDCALIDAIRAIADGRTYFPENIVSRYIEYDNKCDFSQRELEVIELMTNGRTNNEIAYSLGISASGVKMYLKRIFQKLGTTCRAETIATVLRRGIIAQHTPRKSSLD